MINSLLKFVLVCFAVNSSMAYAQNTTSNSMMAYAQSLSQAKDPRAVCQELRKLIEVWKETTKTAQKEYRELIYGEKIAPISIEKKRANYHRTSITQSFTRKLINDHYGLCFELGFDDEIALISAMPL